MPSVTRSPAWSAPRSRRPTKISPSCCDNRNLLAPKRMQPAQSPSGFALPEVHKEQRMRKPALPTAQENHEGPQTVTSQIAHDNARPSCIRQTKLPTQV